MKPEEVLYVCRFVPSYRRPVLELLNERLDGRLTVCAGDPPAGSSFDSLSISRPADYLEIQLQNFWVGGERLHYQRFGPIVSRLSPGTVVLAEESPRSPSLPLLLRSCRKRMCPTILWGHFSSNVRPLGSADLRDRYRMRMATRADAVLCYTPQIAEELKAFVSGQQIFVAQNTLDTNTLFPLFDELQQEGKRSVRKRLGIDQTHIVLFMGRLIPEKGTGSLVETVAQLPTQDVVLLVVGDGPERETLAAQAAEANVDIIFAGAITDDQISAPYVFASDVLLNPGYAGLSVVHALALGVPVVAPSSAGPGRFHSPEWVHIQTDRTGILTESASPADLSRAIRDVIEKQESFSTHARDYARAHLSVDRMLDGMEAAIQYAFGRSPKSQVATVER